jgi:hypothetical protein
MPAGVVPGTAVFQPRSADSEDSSSEYLFTESGILKCELPVHRQWIWSLSKTVETNLATDEDIALSIYFVRRESHTVDHLYQ